MTSATQFPNSGEPDDDLPTGPDARELDELFERLYQRIRRLAARVRWSGSHPTLNPTALAHEAYLKLRQNPLALQNRTYEEAISVFALAMRQVLVDAARRKSAQKRVVAGLPAPTETPIEDVLAISAALDGLERESPVQAQVIKCRFLLGMTIDETAAALGLSKRMTEREWQAAKTHLGEKFPRS